MRERLLTAKLACWNGELNGGSLSVQVQAKWPFRAILLIPPNYRGHDDLSKKRMKDVEGGNQAISARTVHRDDDSNNARVELLANVERGRRCLLFVAQGDVVYRRLAKQTVHIVGSGKDSTPLESLDIREEMIHWSSRRLLEWQVSFGAECTVVAIE